MTSNDAKTAAQMVAERLREAGCRHAFGVPGGEVLTLMQALEASGVAFSLVKHENAGGFMAEGAHHAAALSGEGARVPGVLLATIGPGLANTVNTAANALQEQVPLIILSGSVSAAEAASYTHQVLDQNRLMEGAVKASFTLAQGAVDVLIDRAVSIACADPMGPVHVDLPVSLAGAAQPTLRRYQSSPPSAPLAPAASDLLTRAREKVAASERPLILAGMGAMQQNLAEDIQQAAERLKAPVLTTYKAKGVMPEEHPLSLGGHGLSPKSDAIVLPLLREADCILSIGYDPIEMRAGWIDPFPPTAHIELAHAPCRHGMHGAEFSFVGPLKESLAALTQDVALNQTWPGRREKTAREDLDEAFAAPPEWGPHQAFVAARRASPPNAIVTADSGAHRILLSQIWACPAPRTMLQSAAFCTMGVSLPLAMGVKRAAPERPILAVMGDAGLEMVLGELATLRDWGPGGFCILVLADASLSLIALKQERSNLPKLGVDFGGTDWPALAPAMGGHGVWADDAQSLERALSEGYARKEGFTLIAARIDKKQYDGAF